jgi:membrane glycosyltransferase
MPVAKTVGSEAEKTPPTLCGSSAIAVATSIPSIVAIERVRPPLQDDHRTAIVMIVRLPDTLKVVADLAPILESVAVH